MKILNENGNEFINNWVACKKTSYVIQAKRDDSIKEVYNCLERSNVSVRENEVILKGLLGEMWAISEKKFLDRYTDTKGNSLKYLVEKKNFDWVDVATKASNTILEDNYTIKSGSEHKDTYFWVNAGYTSYASVSKTLSGNQAFYSTR